MITHFLQKIHPKSPILNDYDIQRLTRKASLEEYRIHCLQHVTLLLDSVLRMLNSHAFTTHSGLDYDQVPFSELREDLHSAEYNRFKWHAGNKSELFMDNTVGWQHFSRAVDTLELSIKNLVAQILPFKERELLSSEGEPITANCTFEVDESRGLVQVGQKKVLQNVYTLRLELFDSENPDFKDLNEPHSSFYMQHRETSLVLWQQVKFLLDFACTMSVRVTNICSTFFKENIP